MTNTVEEKAEFTGCVSVTVVTACTYSIQGKSLNHKVYFLQFYSATYQGDTVDCLNAPV